MAHAHSAPSTSKLVRDARTGRMIELRGAGALKGALTIKGGVDLTKPILEQVIRPLGRNSRPSQS